jgi:hypothetical protein
MAGVERNAAPGVQEDVADLGRPIAYLALAEGTPVLDRERRRIGVVDQVIADLDLDLFHGVVVHTHPLPGRDLYADRDQIAELHECAVLLAVTVDDLHEPGDPGPPRRDDHPRGPETRLEAGLRRAWDRIAGRR